MKVVVTGATGLIGKKLSEKLLERGDSVIAFSRNPEKAKQKVNVTDYCEWNPLGNDSGEWKEKIRKADAVIHLAGEGVVDKRWTNEYKKRIIESRTKTTESLVNEIAHKSTSVKQFISASAIGFYGYERKEPVNEESSKGSGFLSDVVQKWEESSSKLENCDILRSIIRIGIVLDKNGGALAKMLPPFKLFIGGPIGSGKQPFPWIHIDDLVDLFVFVLDEKLSGVYNGVASNPVNMNEFAKSLGKVLRRPSIFKVPKFILQIMMGEAAQAVTKGVEVRSNRLNKEGFDFKFANVKDALTNLLS